MDDDEMQKEVNEALEASEPEVREMAAALAKNLFEAAEKILAERKLEPLTEREKILLLGVSSAVTLSTLTAAIGTAVSFGAKP